MFTPFYNNSIRNLVVAFGSLFNDITIIRKNPNGTTKEQIKVPIAYGPKEKFLRLLDEKSPEDKTEVAITLPRLGFEMIGFTYDATRMRNKISRRFLSETSAVTGTSYDYAEVPYDFSFTLSAMVSTMDDGLQILEQVLPYFTPEFTVTINMTSLHQAIDVPIQLTGVVFTDDYDGSFETRRNISIEMSFVAKSYVYGPQKTIKIIKTVDASFLHIEAFTSTGGLSGTTGSVSIVQTGVTGPYGSDSNITNYTANTTKWISGASLDSSGTTY